MIRRLKGSGADNKVLKRVSQVLYQFVANYLKFATNNLFY